MTAHTSHRGSLSFGDKVAVGMFLLIACDAITVKLAVEHGKSEAAKRDRARLDIAALMQAVERYHDKRDSYPEQLAMLLDAGVIEKAPMDPWGQPFIYAVIAGQPVITSYGKDGTPGGEGNDADISSKDSSSDKK
jgi:hypothetical protein